MIERTELRQPPRRTLLWLALFALAYGLLHHQGFVLGRLGTVGGSGTRWADWIDLVTPYIVVGSAALALVSADPSPRQVIVFAAGAIAYVQGHGIHLAANSIGNDLADSGLGVTDVTHLWDEIVGHYIWYGGLAVMVGALALALRPHPLPNRRAVIIPLALLFGLTYATNALEGNTAVMATVSAAGFSIWSAVERRRDAGRPAAGFATATDLLGWAFVPAVLILGFYGLWHRGFPEPTSVGWNPLGP